MLKNLRLRFLDSSSAGFLAYKISRSQAALPIKKKTHPWNWVFYHQEFKVPKNGGTEPYVRLFWGVGFPLHKPYI